MPKEEKRDKAPHEKEALHRFIEFLKSTTGVGHHVIAENVVVDPTTGSNYDYQLAEEGSALPKIAVEIFRLVEDEEDLAAERHRSIFWDKIEAEFAAVGVIDLLVVTPDRVAVLPRDATIAAKTLATAAQKKLTDHPQANVVKLEGGVELRRIEGLGTVACSTHANLRWIDGVGIATPPLIKKLSKKDTQLAIKYLERVILCVNWTWAVDSDDAVNAIAVMDVSGIQNADRVYFDTGETHQLIYARQVLTCPPRTGPVEV